MAILEENDILFAHKALNIMTGLTEATKRVAAAIIDHFNKRTGQCDPGIDRLATMLGIDRATVIRATEKLHDLELIDKASHGGKSHRAAYRPNWDRFRAVVEDWDARMKTGASPDEQPAKVASVRRSRSQACDVKRRSPATQTLRSNPSNKPIEPERVETRPDKPQPQAPQRAQQGLGRGRERPAQRPLLLPISGGRSVSHADAARAAAERRWYAQLHRLGEAAEVEVLNWITADRQDAATEAEMARKGGGLAFIVAAMHQDRRQAAG
ncbi:helix-turn-helix domain-containing protein [Ensifer sp. PDNC004]|uniref:helix-turn-helix domain-containing protein n=1 Tax=Ensifer sp. PDNC004 TaxID=2811423 RepID=UPI0019658BE1|nr:helix-turn-helix domain-containing protein [Ensifer sp. PDNC004]QRY66541.1 helix-turn-helix domain-containing protein [Ensifer sp. PDNC004]